MQDKSNVPCLSIASSNFSYQVKFMDYSDALNSQKCFILIDQKVFSKSRFNKVAGNHTYALAISELTKNLDTCKFVIEAMANVGVDKSYTFVTVGGGATQDIGTISASLYMRGLKWKYVPTTLMSMLDSCIGGKSSINSGEYKNVIGNFYPPNEIIIDVSMLDLQDSVALSNGIAEGLKITYAAGVSFFREFCETIDLWRASTIDTYLSNAIMISLKGKKYFIENDEFDRGVRKNLNFGHTFAHALETASQFQVPHGIAVLIGMKAAIIRSGVPANCLELENRLHSEMKFSGFNTGKILVIDHQQLIDAFRRDKKNIENMQVLVLPDRNGELHLSAFPMTDQILEESAKCLYSALTELELAFEIL
jgi:3-dehydroquinate synthase